MEKEQRVFLAYRAVFEGNNALIRKTKAVKTLVYQHRESAKTLLESLGRKEVIDTLKSLLERKVFQSELEAKLAFPNLFTVSSSQSVQHIASEADAARSEAEALDNAAFFDGHGDDSLDELVDEVPLKQITDEGVTTQTIPSLYPIYIPFRIQHLVLSRAQGLLEECCFDFSMRWLPELLEERQWDCSEAIELNVWTHLAMKRLGKLPSQAFANNSALSWADGLTSIINLRHSAVHRKRTTAKGISEMIRCATRFARVLRDSAREQQLDELNHELLGKIRALELNKNFLETKLERELREIARQRKELDEQEKQAISTMVQEDKDHGSLIGGLLSRSFMHILGQSEDKEQDVTGAERSSDQEFEVEVEHVDDGWSSNRVELDLPVDDQPVSARSIADEKLEPEPDHQPHIKAEGCVETLADLCAETKTQDDLNHKHGSGYDLDAEIEQPATVAPQQVPTSESAEVPEHASTTQEADIGSNIEFRKLNSTAQGSGDHSADQEDLLAGNLPPAVYTAYVKAIDNKLATYSLYRSGVTMLTDKRLRRIRNFVKKQTRLDTESHQNELNNLINLRFATLRPGKRLASNPAPKKEEKSKWSNTHADYALCEAWQTDPAYSPLETQLLPLQDTTPNSQSLPQKLSSPSPSPFKMRSIQPYLLL